MQWSSKTSSSGSDGADFPCSDGGTVYPLSGLPLGQPGESLSGSLPGSFLGRTSWGRESAPIGLFDSGVGGVTVLRELYEQMPHESVVYFGDTARLPYGKRSAEEIIEFAHEILEWMGQQGVKMVIMACNTSSALALEAVQGKYDFPILGLILPGARAAVRNGSRIGVISTEATAKSQAYAQAIAEINAEAQVWQVGCPPFVPLIEGNRIFEAETELIVRDYLAPLLQQQIDTLVYGCTHYPYLEPVLRKILPDSVALIDPASHVVSAAAKELDALGLRSTSQPRPTFFAVSGQPQPFAAMATQMLGYCPQVEQVLLPTLISNVASPLLDAA
ncbi:MAG: glutamate racemase [Synechococcales cyanobacterium RM1_1_8]|nr:glutamate racemase [Synechococcales cyanobacterium RM1_1_8]